MRANNQEQQALIAFLTKLYHEIRDIEAMWGIMAREGDFRPRIEMYHDAVRALTSGSANVYAAGGRLSVEYLAYDVAMLRRIEQMPLEGMQRGGQNQSPGVAVVIAGTPGSQGGRPDREVRSQLSEMYKTYAVFFVALLCDTADTNYQARVDELNEEVTDLNVLDKLMIQLEMGKKVEGQIESVLDQISNEEVRAKINAMIHNKKRKLQELQLTRNELRDKMKGNDKQIAVIEKAHFQYVTSQLAIYENAKETVKKLAGQGMNLAGKFVQGAMQEALGSGRGR